MSFVFNKVKNAVEDVGSTVKGAVTVKKDTHAHTTGPDECSDGDRYSICLPLTHANPTNETFLATTFTDSSLSLHSGKAMM